jgi:hypothetical protein
MDLIKHEPEVELIQRLMADEVKGGQGDKYKERKEGADDDSSFHTRVSTEEMDLAVIALTAKAASEHGLVKSSEAKSYILNPGSEFVKKWDLFITLLLLYTGVITPFGVSFVKGSEINFLYVCDKLVDLGFLVVGRLLLPTFSWTTHLALLVYRIWLLISFWRTEMRKSTPSYISTAEL